MASHVVLSRVLDSSSPSRPSPTAPPTTDIPAPSHPGYPLSRTNTVPSSASWLCPFLHPGCALSRNQAVPSRASRRPTSRKPLLSTHSRPNLAVNLPSCLSQTATRPLPTACPLTPSRMIAASVERTGVACLDQRRWEHSQISTKATTGLCVVSPPVRPLVVLPALCVPPHLSRTPNCCTVNRH